MFNKKYAQALVVVATAMCLVSEARVTTMAQTTTVAVSENNADKKTKETVTKTDLKSLTAGATKEINSVDLVGSALSSDDVKAQILEDAAQYYNNQVKITDDLDVDGKSYVEHDNETISEEPQADQIVTYDEYGNQITTDVSTVSTIQLEVNAKDDTSNEVTTSALAGYDASTSGFVISVTDEDIGWLKRCVAAEAGNQSMEGKQAVAEVIVHRVQSSRFAANTVKNVIFSSGQFSVVADASIYSKYDKLSQENRDEVDAAVYHALLGSNVSDDALFFRTKHYHANTVPIRQIGGHYFSR